MSHLLLRRLLALAGLLAAWPLVCWAEPYLAVEQGLACSACHVNPSGGGLRNNAGVAYAMYALPAHGLPAPLSGWSGRVTDFLRLGGDLRTGETRTQVPGQPTRKQSGLEQFRVYADLALFSDWAGFYLDETLAPGKREAQEAYLRLSGGPWNLKAGRFYLPFAWRLQDNTALVRTVSGISMSVPDKGLELGFESGPWSAQLAYTQGPGNVGTGSGHQVTAQLVRVQPDWRVGAALAVTSSRFGSRQVGGLFGGLRTGPLAWLGEVNLVQDEGYPEGRRKLLAALAEVNWRIARGHSLKLSGEYVDPDRSLRHDHRLRRSLVYEYTPIGFVQLRLGWRRHEGIPQNAIDNRRLAFVELHGMF